MGLCLSGNREIKNMMMSLFTEFDAKFLICPYSAILKKSDKIPGYRASDLDQHQKSYDFWHRNIPPWNNLIRIRRQLYSRYRKNFVEKKFPISYNGNNSI